ncbi:hypothetical protein Nepgr_012613 [Nepenthes gracilis]|uniref:Uncharacterized protein n=1 Tax=Nepenthes gracilis TaxID=150966 RepID=A0AAD3SHL2_NEPGR|nr:hypothetical protein Nepgr_012613 [Nepenthes gracilis]
MGSPYSGSGGSSHPGLSSAEHAPALPASACIQLDKICGNNLWGTTRLPKSSTRSNVGERRDNIWMAPRGEWCKINTDAGIGVDNAATIIPKEREWSCPIQHSCMEVNEAAYLLAKLGRRSNEEVQVWHTPPPEIWHILSRESTLIVTGQLRSLPGIGNTEPPCSLSLSLDVFSFDLFRRC